SVFDSTCWNARALQDQPRVRLSGYYKAEQGHLRSIWSDSTGSAIPSRVGPVILPTTQVGFDAYLGAPLVGLSSTMLHFVDRLIDAHVS
ncbi:unnamed protein product, partial [Ascophyllum nodosum]